MMLYRQYFNELRLPESGIDTISIWINPEIINDFGAFHEKGDIRSYINFRKRKEINHKTGTVIRMNYFLELQAEIINPSDSIQYQILVHLVNMSQYGVLKRIPDRSDSATMNFFYESFSYLFALQCLDFYFDMKEEDIKLSDVPNPRYATTRYSSNYPSSLKVYDRRERLIAKNHFQHDTIYNLQLPYRIEFHLERGNCRYMDIRNLEGNYEMVFLRYLPFLARKWHDFRYQVIEIPFMYRLTYAQHLNQVVNMAHSRIPQPNLYYTPPKPDLTKRKREGEIDTTWLGHYYSTLSMIQESGT
jgi:hypothetical protein